MAPRHRSFTTAPPTDDVEPVTFDIDGETFTCRSFVPGAVILDHERRLTSPQQHIAAGEMLAMWGKLLPTDPPTDDNGNPALDDNDEPVLSEHERFLRFIHDPERRVDLQLLGELMMWVVTEIAGRPTVAPSDSAPSSPPNGATSKRSPAAKASTS